MGQVGGHGYDSNEWAWHVLISPYSRALSIFKYFDPSDSLEESGGAGPGYIILNVVKILGEGPESLVDTVMNCGLCSVLVQCVSLMLELPPPCSEWVGGCGLSVMLHSNSIGRLN